MSHRRTRRLSLILTGFPAATPWRRPPLDLPRPGEAGIILPEAGPSPARASRAARIPAFISETLSWSKAVETIVSKLLDSFELGQMSRRDLVRNLAAAALAVGGTGSGRALAAEEPAAGEPDSFRTAGLDHISFSVSDYGRSRDFYSDLMGWDVVEDDGERQAELQMADLGQIIIRNSRAPLNEAPTAVVDHIAWRIEDFDAGAVEEELARRGIENLGRDRGLGPGVPVEPDSEWGRRGYDSYIFRDPDGWAVQVSK